MKFPKLVNGVERAQAMGVTLRYATPKTAVATVTQRPDGTFGIAVEVPLSDIKPREFNVRVRKALQNGFTPSLQLADGSPVTVAFRGDPPVLQVHATLTKNPELIESLEALQLTFTHPRDMPSFTLDLQLGELVRDVTPVARADAERAVDEARAELARRGDEFEAAKANAPREAAALAQDKARVDAALREAEATVAQRRATIDALAAGAPTDRLARVLRGLGDAAGADYLTQWMAVADAERALSAAEGTAQLRAEVSQAGVDPDEVVGAPDLEGARASLAAARQRLGELEGVVRRAFAARPDALAHHDLAMLLGARGDAEALLAGVNALAATTVDAKEVARLTLADPTAVHAPGLEAARAELRRLELALATLEPVRARQTFDGYGSDQAQRLLFGVADGQSWDDWRKQRHALARANPEWFDVVK